MGENQILPLQLSFNGFLRVAFQGSRVTSNGGLILVRELEEHLGFGSVQGPARGVGRQSGIDWLAALDAKGVTSKAKVAWLPPV